MSAHTPTRAQVTRAYRRRLGQYEITALSDGFVDLSYNVWQNISKDEFNQSLGNKFLFKDGIRNGISSFIINTGSKIILVDAGAAGLFGPNSYHFPNNLADAGFEPSDIDEVIMTHAHPDHIGGLFRDGQATLPNAVLRLDETELDFWTSAASQAKAPDFMRGWWDAIRPVFESYKDRTTTFKAGADLGEGITAVGFPGHTPGHTGFHVETGGERLMILGDLVVHHAIQFAHPKASMIFDIDPERGFKSRSDGLELAANERVLTAATHLPFPTFGYVARHNGAYEWVPEVWQHDLANIPWNPVA